jgi:NAD+ diphosphatase
MQGLGMEKNLNYTGMKLNRSADLRRDLDWVEKHLKQKNTVIIPIWRGLNLVRFDKLGVHYPKCVLPIGSQAYKIIDKANAIIFLGLEQEIAYFAADISAKDKIDIQNIIETDQFEDLRRVGALMTPEHGALLAYARGMIYWHQRHLFCGVCGEPTKSHNGGHMLMCQNKQEAHMHFPRTDPAVIMLVVHNNPNGRGPACLLGRQKKWVDGMYSTLAGFVEPGETLEEAVAREVFEEAAVHIKDIYYQASQPWPFPSSLMLGFRAQAISTEIKVDDRELEDAKWFTIDDLQSFCEKSDEISKKYRLPGKDSISRYLIDDWIKDMASD